MIIFDPKRRSLAPTEDVESGSNEKITLPVENEIQTTDKLKAHPEEKIQADDKIHAEDRAQSDDEAQSEKAEVGVVTHQV